jgi:hypothetical protein
VKSENLQTDDNVKGPSSSTKKPAEGLTRTTLRDMRRKSASRTP